MSYVYITGNNNKGYGSLFKFYILFLFQYLLPKTFSLIFLYFLSSFFCQAYLFKLHVVNQNSANYFLGTDVFPAAKILVW